ncbi:MAG TPA: NYN domain-containing protein [Anaerolineales bacterium]|nr:NYN domain-containing protein [Anaerolineales bacterium]
MPTIIDGHNLIPKIPGFNLGAIDDEIQLVELLQEYCRLSRKRVEVYFDNAPPGQSRAKTYGNVTVHFVRQGRTADQAIRDKLSRLGGRARNWTVVSSDREVQSAARAARARVTPAQVFAKRIMQFLKREQTPGEMQDERSINPDELDDWLKLFGVDEGPKE